MLGWVPLKTVYESDYGSLDSEEKGELDGDEVIEILDPTTGEVIEPDSVSLKRVDLHLLDNQCTVVSSYQHKRAVVCCCGDLNFMCGVGGTYGTVGMSNARALFFSRV